MSNMATLSIIIIGVLMVGGCDSTHQQLTARDQAECKNFGFQPGSDQYAACVVQLHATRYHQPPRYR